MTNAYKSFLVYNKKVLTKSSTGKYREYILAGSSMSYQTCIYNSIITTAMHTKKHLIILKVFIL